MISKTPGYPANVLAPGEKIVYASGMILVYDRGNNLVYLAREDGTNIYLSGAPYRAFELLCRHPGQVLPYERFYHLKEELEQRCVSDEKKRDAVRNIVRKLRSLIRPQLHFNPVKNQYGRGYYVPK